MFEAFKALVKQESETHHEEEQEVEHSSEQTHENIWKYKKIYSLPPLPFVGNKRLWRKRFKQLIKELPHFDVYVDCFGGSGILSRYIKDEKPDSIVIYNDFDNYTNRINKIPETNKILNEIRSITSKYKDQEKIKSEDRNSIIKIINQYPDADIITLKTTLMFRNTTTTAKDLEEAKQWYNNIVKTDYNADNYLDDLIIEHLDYKELIDKVEKDYKNKKILYILDPPYLYTSVAHYKNYSNLSETIDLIEMISGKSHILFNDGRTGSEKLFEYINKIKGYNKEIKKVYNKMQNLCYKDKKEEKKDFLMVFL